MAVPRKLTFGRALTQVRLAPKFPCRQQHPRLRAGNALRPPSLPVPARTGSRGDRRAAPLAHSAERAGQTHEAERVRRESPRTDPAPSHRHPHAHPAGSPAPPATRYRRPLIGRVHRPRPSTLSHSIDSSARRAAESRRWLVERICQSG